MSLQNLYQIKKSYESKTTSILTTFSTAVDTEGNLDNHEFDIAITDNTIEVLNDSDNILFYDDKIKQHPYVRNYLTSVTISNTVGVHTTFGSPFGQVSTLRVGNLVSGWVWWWTFSIFAGDAAQFDFTLPIDRVGNFTSPMDAWGSICGLGSSGAGIGYFEAIVGTKLIRCYLNTVYGKVGPTTFISQINYYV